MAGADLIVEYIGGPKDGEKAALLRTSPRVPKGYPRYIQYCTRDPHSGHEQVIGNYIRHNMRPDERAMRYVWTWVRS